MVEVILVSVWEPEVVLLPLQPPLAVQEVVFAEDQVRVLDPPEVMEVGEALKFRVGAGGAVTVTLALCVTVPPPPVHARV